MNNKQSTREIFDEISLNVIDFLENHIGINEVYFLERNGMFIIYYTSPNYSNI